MIDGTPLVYLRSDGDRPDALPIVLTNGWPSTFLERLEFARRLDTSTVVIPVLPGLPHAPQRPSLGGLQTHELWHRIMYDELGFERYAAYRSYLGAGTTAPPRRAASGIGGRHPPHLGRPARRVRPR